MTRTLDEVLPPGTVQLRHTTLFRVPAERVFRAALDLDLLRHPMIRTLIAARTLPVGRPGPPALRITDLVGERFGWFVLAERPGSELVLATVARPWRLDAPPPPQPSTPAEFAAFTEPGHVTIVLTVRAVPQGPGAATLTVETRVAPTDPAGASRFDRYWRLVRPFSELIRRTALRMLARELDPPAGNGGEILIGRSAETVFDAVADERVEPRYNPRIRHVEMLTPEPPGVGTRFRADAGTGARPTRMTITYTRYDRPRRLDSTTRMSAMDIDYTLTVEPTGAGTVLHWMFDLHPRGALRPLRPVIAAVGRRQERRNWAALRDYLEAGPGEHRP